ncbi:hypothetical protein FD754_014263 [Muntiacus muntjak]|uniref:PAS domain-containing protein n=1 Tax=Muntiacus muntjak TaxID=9888 RepID=A0A5N3VMY8_MUNMU|nr:hypothetical protein FD754_014263 [Muntiacus muntjak]
MSTSVTAFVLPFGPRVQWQSILSPGDCQPACSQPPPSTAASQRESTSFSVKVMRALIFNENIRPLHIFVSMGAGFENEKPVTTFFTLPLPLQVELTGSSVFDYVHPGDHVEMAEQLGMKLPPGRGLLSQGTTEDGASSASSSSQSETPEPGGTCNPNIINVCFPI